MGNLKIVEYEKKYSSSIADMWNASSDNWGGYDSVRTEKDVDEEIKNSGNLNTYLALDGDKVAGFCSFSEYREDEGASYIPLLNVRPDYHGKKIGKELVLHVLNRALETEWPRLDLYTWPGNTKAVPLYKKCGFFWEKREDTTHLMNFIPTVLKTEAIKENFETIDWYKDSKRVIEVKPDGRKENGFELFEYFWKKDNKELRVEFERRGRGLRLIETEDYKVSAIIESHELVFGRNYKVKYEVINKSGENLEVSIKGLDDKNIKFTYEESDKVNSSKTFEGEFYIEEIKEEQSIWKTHPCVSAKILINGKEAIFKLGIVPKFPAKLSLAVPDIQKYKGVEAQCYLDIENSFNEDAIFEIELLDSKEVKFMNRKIEVNLKAKEKTSIELNYSLDGYGFYSTAIPVRIKLKNEELKFEKKVSAVFRGYTGRFGGEIEDGWIICNGSYMLKLNKFHNQIEISTYIKDKFETVIMYPKIGLPFSLEFSKMKPEKIELYEEDSSMIMKARYISKDFAGLELVVVSKLHSNGILEHYYEIHNTSEKETSDKIIISQNIYNDLVNAIIPYEGKAISIDGNYGGSYDYWDSEKVSENWMFSQGKKLTRGITWNKDEEIKLNGWYMAIHSNLGVIEAKGMKITKPIFIACGVFNDWKEFRRFAVSENTEDKLKLINNFEFEINDGNPFVTDNFNVKIKDYKKTDFNGEIEITSKSEAFNSVGREFSKEDKNREVDISIQMTKDIDFDIVELNVDFENIGFSKKSAIFMIGDNEIKDEIVSEEGKDVYLADNGVIKVKAAPEFSNALFSLTYKNEEWLDSSFPTPKPKSWWSPWVGGMECYPEKLRSGFDLKEERKADFVRIKDNLGNEWSGIRISLKVVKNEQYKGLELNQYYLLLPGVPVLLNTTEIIQNTGHYFDSIDFVTSTFLRLDEDVRNSWFICKNSDGEFIKYKAGRVEADIITNPLVIYEGKNREDKFMVISPNSDSVDAYCNNQLNTSFIHNNIDAGHKSRIFTPPVFMIFNEDYIEDKLLKDLKNIKFCR